MAPESGLHGEQEQASRPGTSSRPNTRGSNVTFSEAGRTQPEFPKHGSRHGDVTRPQSSEEGEKPETRSEAWVSMLWTKLDRDRSGSIDREELNAEPFHEVIRAAVAPDKASTGGASVGRAELNMKAAINFAMRKADGNMNGELSYKEFRSLLLSVCDPNASSADLAFSLFDLDQGGTIDKKEFKEMMRFFFGRMPNFKDFSEQWELLTSTGESNEEATKWQYITWLRSTLHPLLRAYAPPVGTNETNRSFFGQAPKKSLKMHERPRWNPRFNSGPNPGHLNDKRPQGERIYFSKAQSLPQLQKFYAQHGDHFSKHMDELKKPPPPRTTAALHPKSLSSEGGTPLTLPERHCTSGNMRDHQSNRLSVWEDQWTTPLRFRKRSGPPGDRPLTLRATFGEINDRHSRWAAQTFGGGFGRGPWNGGKKGTASAKDPPRLLDNPLRVRPLRHTAFEAEPW